jgi:hypothetical protein
MLREAEVRLSQGEKIGKIYRGLGISKIDAECMTLSASIFDHSKIAMIDEMIGAGVPLHNPFFGETVNRIA